MASTEASKMNLAALRKVDSSISSIVDTANQVALYKYVSESSKWEKTEVEGTLFVYMRSQKPQHGFMVMNRLNTTNLVEPITEKLDFQDQTPFLLYRNGKGGIYGVWFYEKKLCVKICKLLSSLSQLAFTKPDKSSSGRQRSYSESNRKQKHENSHADILSLLSRAQDEYDKKSSKGTSVKAPRKNQAVSNGDIVKPTPVRLNGVTSPTKSTPLTLGMLFAQASGVEKKPNENLKDYDSRVRSFTTGSGGEHPTSSTEAILQNLLSNSAHTLQHIEGLQNDESGNEKEPKGRAPSAIENMVSVETLEKDLKEKLNLLPKGLCDISLDTKVKIDKKDASDIVQSAPIDIPIITPAMFELSFPSAPNRKVGSYIEKPECFYDAHDSSNTLVKTTGSLSPTHLLSPMDFTMPVRRKILQPSYSYSPDVGSNFINGNSQEELPQHQVNGSSSGRAPKVTPLNKDQLREALVYMLQNDDNFVIQLHECYVKSLKSQLAISGSS